MLLKLLIENYALIHSLEMDFSVGFTVITGETGAGKSILVGALALILGQRADTSVLLDKEKKCFVEGSFQISSYNLETFFDQNDLDYNDITILRREIGQNGKSRAFINDTPVNLTLLKELGDKLVNIHSQHSIITLNDSNFQLAVLDDFAGNNILVSKLRQQFKEYQNLQHELDSLIVRQENGQADQDYNKFLLDELTRAELRQGEQEELEHRQEILAHAEEIKSGLVKSVSLISESDSAILTQLSEVVSSLNGISKYHQGIKEIAERINSNIIDIKDIYTELFRLENTIYFDHAEIESVNNRLEILYRLQRKHSVHSVEELVNIKQNIDNKLNNIVDLEEQIKDLNNRLSRVILECSTIGGALSESRLKHLSSFENLVYNVLKNIGMPSAIFKIDLTKTNDLTKDGYDKIRFLFTANPGMPASELSRIASGGELSRVMLSIKSMISRKNLLPTIVFDEIDSGVSGDIAGKVGNILKQMSDHMQVIVITHLPQIAGKATHHFWVYKQNDQQSTRSFIKQLTLNERVEEIAKMLSNETVTKSAYQTAKELLMN